MSHPSRTFRLAAIVVAVFALLASGCGSADDEAASDTTAPAADLSTTTAPTVEEDEPTTTTAVADPEPATEDDGGEDSILTEVVLGSFKLGDAEEVVFDELGFDTELDLGEGPVPALVGVFGEGLFVIPVDLATQQPTGAITVLTPDFDFWSAEEVAMEYADDVIQGGGPLTSGSGEQADVVFTMPVGLGTSTFEIDDTNAIVRGDLGAKTFEQVEYLVENHPEVDTLVLQDISGSVNDEVNVQTGRLVREAGLNTFVPANGEIFSGGVDLFAAGLQRTIESGATLGVHAWCCGPEGESAHELAQDDPAHDDQLAYFTEMLGADLGPEFYFFTLAAAPFDGVHPMTADELTQYLLTTES